MVTEIEEKIGDQVLRRDWAKVADGAWRLVREGRADEDPVAGMQAFWHLRDSVRRWALAHDHEFRIRRAKCGRLVWVRLVPR